MLMLVLLLLLLLAATMLLQRSCSWQLQQQKLRETG
jgi:hypothetical protein